jgi:molybdate transport system substrate-binding protein
MRCIRFRRGLVGWALWALAGTPAAALEPAPPLTVHAAASLTEALQECVPLWTAQGGGRIAFDFGASSLLARQIRAGAPGDVFFSADEAQMDTLAARGLLLPGSRRSLLANRLVVVVRAGGHVPIDSPADLVRPEVERIAIAEPHSVPAGVYAKRWLERHGWWERLAPRLVPTDNVRAALAAVASGNVEAGIVYATDAGVEPRVRIAFEVAAADGPPISYPAAGLRASRAPDEARRFVDFLGGAAAQAVFVRHGFRPLATP